MLEFILFAYLGYMMGKSFTSPNIAGFEFISDGERRFVLKYVPKFDFGHYLGYEVNEDVAPAYLVMLGIIFAIVVIPQVLFLGVLPGFSLLLAFITLDVATYNKHRWLSVTWWNEEWRKDYMGNRRYPYELPKDDDEG
jgi:hypothetical protein